MKNERRGRTKGKKGEKMDGRERKVFQTKHTTVVGVLTTAFVKKGL